MTTAIASHLPPAAAPLVATAPEQRFLIHGLDWATYEKLLDVFIDCGPRMCYLDGTVEQMTTGARHERLKKILARMVEDILVELCIPANALGSATFKRESVGRGVEPDECYYIANVDRVGGAELERIDLEVMPPPDLVIEVEITSPLLDKLAIYAGLGVPELWRYDGRSLAILLLQADGSYLASPRSRAFPFLPVEGFGRHLGEYDPRHESRWALTYRTWVREVVAPLYQP